MISIPRCSTKILPWLNTSAIVVRTGTATTMVAFATPCAPTNKLKLHTSFTTRQFNERRIVAPKARTARMSSGSDLAVMVNGIPGRMATSVANEVLRRGLILAEESLTGPYTATSEVRVNPEAHEIHMRKPEEHAECLRRMREKYGRLIAVDYTQPDAANSNAAAYAAAGVSFVMGTTGGDEAAMRDAVTASGVYAVIAPNMGKQIVAFQAMMQLMADQFPGAFNGYTLRVTESHQATKVDTSGTAKAVIRSFNRLGVPFELDQVDKVRDAQRSMQEMGVPGKYVTAGHAYHTYRLQSEAGDVAFEFQHNVCGRGFYAAGTVDAVLFLDDMRAKGGDKHVFNMIDILRAGNMK